MRALTRIAAVLTVTLSSGCGGPTVDLTTALVVTDVATGWHDAGVVNGQNKIVPAISFKLKNGSEQPLSSLYVNVVFRRLNEDVEWGAGYLRVAGADGLSPGAVSDVIRVNSEKGYTGLEARADMLKNRQFVDAKVQISARYASTPLTKIAEFPVARQLEVK